MFQHWCSSFASTAQTETESHIVRVAGFDFLENIIDEPRAGTVKVSFAFEYVIDVMGHIRLDNTTDDLRQSGKGGNLHFSLTTWRCCKIGTA